jgi:hypothetical protein
MPAAAGHRHLKMRAWDGLACVCVALCALYCTSLLASLVTTNHSACFLIRRKKGSTIPTGPAPREYLGLPRPRSALLRRGEIVAVTQTRPAAKMLSTICWATLPRDVSLSLSNQASIAAPATTLVCKRLASRHLGWTGRIFSRCRARQSCLNTDFEQLRR